MPVYDFLCPNCGHQDSCARPVKLWRLGLECVKCKVPMRRNYRAEAMPNVRGDYKKPIALDSMAIRPEEVAEHRRLFPDVAIAATGPMAGVPVVRSLNQKRKYAAAMGWIDRNSFVNSG